jgi:hypothetical protein
MINKLTYLCSADNEMTETYQLRWSRAVAAQCVLLNSDF